MDETACLAQLDRLHAQSLAMQRMPTVVNDSFLPDMGRMTRVIALGRKNSLFAGSDGGARHWATVASLVATAKLNGVEPQAWLTDVLERMVSGRTKAHELARLLPWTWKAERLAAAVDA
jgi:hypothetical protein